MSKQVFIFLLVGIGFMVGEFLALFIFNLQVVGIPVAFPAIVLMGALGILLLRRTLLVR